LNPVLSLRSFNREFTRFEKKHYPWSDLINKNSSTPQLFDISQMIFDLYLQFESDIYQMV